MMNPHSILHVFRHIPSELIVSSGFIEVSLLEHKLCEGRRGGSLPLQRALDLVGTQWIFLDEWMDRYADQLLFSESPVLLDTNLLPSPPVARLHKRVYHILQMPVLTDLGSYTQTKAINLLKLYFFSLRRG